jgi:hypothetical protein
MRLRLGMARKDGLVGITGLRQGPYETMGAEDGTSPNLGMRHSADVARA